VGRRDGRVLCETDSKYKTLADVIKALKADPKSVTFAGGSAPAAWITSRPPSSQKPSVSIPPKVVYVPFQGGGERLTSLLGGHTEVGTLDVSEGGGQRRPGRSAPGGAIRDPVQQVQGHSHHYEQGVKVTFPICAACTWLRPFPMRPYSSGPRDPEDGSHGGLESARERLGWEATYKSAPSLQFVNDEDVSYQGLLKELGFVK